MAHSIFCILSGFLLLRFGAPVVFPVFAGSLAAEAVCRITGRIAGRFGWQRRRTALCGAWIVLLGGIGALLGCIVLCGGAGQWILARVGELRAGLFLLWEKLRALPVHTDAAAWIADRLYAAAEAAILRLAGDIAHAAGRTIGAAGDGAVKCAAGVCVYFFRCADAGNGAIRGAIRDRMPANWLPGCDRFLAYADRVTAAACRYAGAAVGLSGGAFLVFAAGFLIGGQEHALMLAFLAALADLLPVVGAGIVLLPWAVVRFLIGDAAGGIVTVVLLILQWTLRQYVEPRWFGSVLSLHPCLTLVAAYIGYAAAGFQGMLLLPLCLAGVKR